MRRYGTGISENRADPEDFELKKLEEDKDIENNTVVGVMTNIFDNDQEIREELNATTVGKVFDHLKEEVEK